jgi:hypothetical protein
MTEKDVQLDLGNLAHADFTGRTDFLALTADQKLDWLASMVIFTHENRLVNGQKTSARRIQSA